MKKLILIKFVVINVVNFGFSHEIQKIVSGKSHTLILLKNGEVWGFGWNNAGQIGNGTTKNIIKPVKIEFLKDIIDIGAGDIHSLCIRKDGIVLSFGGNFSGQLGNFSNENFDFPVIVREKNLKFFRDAVKVACGWDFSVILKKDGTVWAFGENKCGQLGDGKKENRNYPLPVKNSNGIGFLKDIVDIKAGAFHCLALAKDGTVFAWGDNQFGQLGDGTYRNRNFPVKVKNFNGSGYLKNIKKIECGAFHSGAITSDGYVLMWGKNWKGQLGDGTYENKNIPTFVKDENGDKFIKNIVEISLGRNHTILLNKDGYVFIFGSNKHGQLGNNIIKRINIPIAVNYNGKILKDIVKISASGSYSVALSKNGILYYWGTNEGFLDTPNQERFLPTILFKF
ncbi:MAG: hypothetical protein NC926_08390 [Candidatus Omnitrophica bacterium]|nr:hypothetical protein [Candidatus Omnitrophota bacterium]